MVPAGFGSAVVWLMDECLLDPVPTMELLLRLAFHLL